ncbi:hypothetical protein CQ018_10785 [Arthrobacter sp. MYb227]|uniref:KAP family P-loop NTPase fold protein n=1 Tax=Arthrobacter sp. MYb227 TaxID=1848601 RepID=UPI000CFC3716|nr:P-loop NTPase fold protein [Arthrobacter sp. MYb227]PQZ92945.1 hypothetical protein CQ018_10785 [Arthrobacter sp. MYb227]
MDAADRMPIPSELLYRSVEIVRKSSRDLGFDDVPAIEDSLSISSYIDGLVDFINTCPSPMTLAVQGAWGTGKTSAMLQIGKKLRDERNDVQTIFFNTWQYSQFDLGENLAISMLKAIAEGLKENQPENQKSGKFENLTRLILRAGRIYASKTVPAVLDIAGMAMAAKAVGAAIETGSELMQANVEEPDSVKILASLREAFEFAVAESNQRVVVFIDDLDRLAPGRAIEVMEAIKVFLDVQNCVFVLAIDFDVVKMGVQEKYSTSVSERKARSFFDKIIQVPFHMPVARYKMEAFFEQGLKLAGIENVSDDFEKFMELSAASVGSNPRSTKRLLNTFLLLKSILAKEKDDFGRDLHLFGTLCLQTAFPEAYAAIADSARHSEPADEFLRYAQFDEDAKNTTWGIPTDEIGLLDHFYEELTRAFTIKGEFSKEAFNSAFSQSTITSVTSGGATQSRVTRTFDRNERRLRSVEKRSESLVDLAFQFENELTLLDEAFAAQTNPIDWTMRMRQDQARIGLLTIRANDLKIAFEFKSDALSIDDLYNEAQNFETRIVGQFMETDSSTDNTERPKVRRFTQANKRYVIVEVTMLKTPAQVSALVTAVRPFYAALAHDKSGNSLQNLVASR